MHTMQERKTSGRLEIQIPYTGKSHPPSLASGQWACARTDSNHTERRQLLSISDHQIDLTSEDLLISTFSIVSSENLLMTNTCSPGNKSALEGEHVKLR